MIYIGLLIPFIGTIIGSLFVFFIKNEFNKKNEAILLSLAAGIMFAASIWSLILPSIEMGGVYSTIIGIVLGILFFSFIKCNNSKMFFAVTLHNIPEGMAVAVCFLSLLVNNSISLISCFMLSIGIALQNIPEGAIISLPLCNKGYSKNKSFLYGVLSGIVEPLFGLLTILLTGIVVPILPYLLGFAAGAMIYVCIEELIPEASFYKYSTLFFSIGFIIMMFLDVIFG